MRRPRLMSLIASLVCPGDEDFLRRIDAMYSTAKDSMENDEANDEDDLMGDLVDELVLGDMSADDKQDFRMVSDAVQKRRIRRVQQTWQSIKKNVAAKTKAKAKAKAKAKGKGKGKGKGRVRKFLRPRMLPKKRPGAPDEGRVPGPEADDQNVGMDGGVPRPEAADQNLEGRVPRPGPDDLDVDVMEQEPDNHVEAEEPEVPAMPADPPGERVVIPRGPQQGERQPRRDWKGVWRSVQCPHCPKVAGEMKCDPNPGTTGNPTWSLRVRITDGGLLERFKLPWVN